MTRPPSGCRCCGRTGSHDEDCLVPEMARVVTERDIMKARLDAVLEYAEGHPGMCCGQCHRAIAKAEAEVGRFRAALAHVLSLGVLTIADEERVRGVLK